MVSSKVYTLLLGVIVISILLFFLFRTTPTDTLLLNEWLLSTESGKAGIENHGCVRLPFLGEVSQVRYAQPGTFWFTSTFELETLRPCTLTIAGCDDSCEVYINGIRAGVSKGMSRNMKVPLTHYVQEGKNEVQIKVSNSGGSAALYQPIEVSFSSESERGSEHRRESKHHFPFIVYEIAFKKETASNSLKALREVLPSYPHTLPSIVYLSNIFQTSEIAYYAGWQRKEAIRNHYAISEKLGSREDVRDVISLAHQMNMKVVIDFIPDRTAWDSDILMLHPEWFIHNEKGEIVSPSCAEPEVAKLNVNSHEVKKYLLGVVRYWTDSVGVDGFRCSYVNGVPVQFWKIVRNTLKERNIILLANSASIQCENIFDGVIRCDVGSVIEKIVVGKYPITILHHIFGGEYCGNALTVCTIDPDALRKIQPLSDSDVQALYIIGTVWQLLFPGATYISSTQYSYCKSVLEEIEPFMAEMKNGNCRVSTEVRNDSVVMLQKQCAEKAFLSITNLSSKTQRVDLGSLHLPGHSIFQHRVETKVKKNEKYFVSLRQFGTIVLLIHGRSST